MTQIQNKNFANDNGLSMQIITSNLDVNQDNINHLPIMGGMSDPPTWDEYLDSFIDKYQPHFLLIKESIEKNNLIGETASNYANYIAFSFSDGIYITFSWRAWGDLMQSIINKKEGYMKYYM
jgi:hypothetical protein